MFFRKVKSTVGIDIGTGFIKVAQILPGEQPVLETYGIANNPKPISTQTTEAEVQSIAAVLTELLRRAKVTSKRCVASLPNATVFSSVIDLPVMPLAELEAAVQFEAKKYVPLPFEEVTLSWTVIAPNDDNQTQKILLVAVPNHIRDIYVSIFQAADLELVALEIEALALVRSLCTEPKENSVIIDIGAKSTGLNFVKQDQLQLTRNLSIGSDTITDRLAQALNLAPSRAEQFKHDFGLNENSFLPEAVKPVLGTIRTEVSQLLAIYRSHGTNTDRLILTGGGAGLPGIIEFFSDLGPKVILGSPIARLSYPMEVTDHLTRMANQLPVAIGLALRTET